MRTARRHKSEERGTKGHAIVEVAFMIPWLFFLFVGVFDFGFYAYALISTSNAARVAALHTSSSLGAAGDAPGACTHVVQELQYMPNVGTSLPTTCTCAGATCTSGPVRVTADAITGTACPDGVSTAQCSRVTVTYTTINLIPIPMLNPPGSVTRIVEARVKPE